MSASDQATVPEDSHAGPIAVVSSIPDVARVVEIRISSRAPVLRTITTVSSEGESPPMSDKLNEIDGRLRTVETDVATIKERLNHMPTTVGMWTALLGVVVPVGVAVVGVLWWVIQSSLAPLLEKAVGG